MASDCDKEIERVAREGCMMIDDWVFGNTLAEDKYPALKECLVRIVTDALRIPGDCVRRGSDGKLLRITHAIIDDAEGEPLAFGYQCVPAEAARGEGSK